MNIAEHYTKLYEEAVEKIQSDQYQIDHLINSSSDNRFGITLLIRPDDSVKNEIQKFIDPIKAIEPGQYYYPKSDIHVTVLSLISCYQGFELKQISVPDYVQVIQKSIADFHPFKIEFRGITASPSCIMIQGFTDNTLNNLRNKLRVNFKNSGLEQSIDKRYSIQAAHATVVRFMQKLNQEGRLIKMLNNWRNHCFGTFQVNTLELVYNDWYQQKKRVKKLHQFKLRQQ